MTGRRTVLALLATAVGLTTAGLVLTGPGTAVVADAAASAALAESGPAERGLRITTRAAADPAAQLAEAEAILAAHLPGTVLSTTLTFPVTSGAGDVVLAYSPRWADRVALTGAPPAPRPDGVVEVAAPAAAGLAVGAQLTVGQAAAAVVVTAVWEPLDAADPLWFSDPGLAAGTVAEQRPAVGPLFTAGPEHVAAVVDVPRQRWVLVPPADLTEQEAADVAARLGEAPGLLADAGLTVRGQVVDGAGPEHLADLAAGLRRSRAHAAVSLALVAVAGVVSALAVRRAAAGLFRRERELLAARGATTRWAAAREAPGVAVTAVVGALLGGAAGLGGVAALAGGDAALTGDLLGPLALAAGLPPVVGAGIVLVRPRPLPVDRGRGRMPLVLATVVVVAAAVATLQLLRTGPVSGGRAEVAAAAAPALLLALTGVGAAWLGRRGPALAGLARRRPGLTALLTVRGLAPPWPDAAALALAAGALVLAAGADGGRPQVGAAWVGAAVGAALAGVTLGAGALGRRRAIRAARPVLDRLGATAPATRARRSGLALGWVLAVVVGAAAAAAVAGVLTPGGG